MNMRAATSYLRDDRVVLTLDGGGTSFRFAAMRGGAAVTETIVLPTNGDDLDACLNNLVSGFARVRVRCPHPPVAISFAFPGPASDPHGVLGGLANIPAFREGVPLGPMLEEEFKLPVFINNDGDMFAYGEAIAGLLPEVNALLEEAGSVKRFRNLLGVTIGTGFGGGLVRDGEIFLGDNAVAGEIGLLSHKHNVATNAEETVSIRGVRRAYARCAGIPFDEAPEPRVIAEIGAGNAPGNRVAAAEAFRELGEVAGAAMANALALVDGLAVIGGGLSGASSLFFPALMKELNGHYTAAEGHDFRRVIPHVFNLEDPQSLQAFLASEKRELPVPRSLRKIAYDPMRRIGVGLSRLGTTRATAVGCYAYALRRLG